MMDNSPEKIDDIILSVKNLKKAYRLYESPNRMAAQRFIELISFGMLKYHYEHWALRGVSFQVHKGETLGIIGHNGSGKSTLLKLLCGITYPNEGDIRKVGTIAAILELGTGFSHELTGRENVYLNAALMGYSKAKTAEKIKAIEDFAEIGEYFDQPVRFYSSGMFIRLAFALNIHVDPDILIVDEALAVGDRHFQQKCYHKFREFKELGKTILLVTHDMDLMVRHCDRAILLTEGSIAATGEAREMAKKYSDIMEGISKQPLNSQIASSKREMAKSKYSKGNEAEFKEFLEDIPNSDQCVYRRNYNPDEIIETTGHAEIVDFFVNTNDRYDVGTISPKDTVEIYVKVQFNKKVKSPLFGISLRTNEGLQIYGFNTFLNKSFEIKKVSNSNIVIFKFSLKIGLLVGDILIDIGVDEKCSPSYVSLVRRKALIHLIVNRRHSFDGFVDLNIQYLEIKRMPTNN